MPAENSYIAVTYVTRSGDNFRGEKVEMTTDLNSHREKLDLNFDPAVAKPRRTLSGLVTVLVGATVLIGGVVISTIAIDDYDESAHLSAVNAEPVIRSDAGEGERNTNFYASIEAHQNDTQMLSPSLPERSDDTIEQPYRLSEAPAYPAVSIEEQGSIVSAALSPADQSPTPAPVFSSRETAVIPQHNGAQQTTNTAPPAEVAALALPEKTMAPPSTQLTLPTAMTAKARVLPRSPSSTDKQPATAGSASWRIQLISLSNQMDAEVVWTKLQKANQDLLDGLTPHVQTVYLSKGTFHRVQAGPFMDRATAASLCTSLKARNQDCLVVAP